MDYYEDLYKRYWATREYKDRWTALFSQLYLYVIPDRDAFNIKWNYNDQGKPNTTNIWDNTAMLAGEQRANDLHGLLMPKDRVWGKFTMDPHLFSRDEISGMQSTVDEVNDNVFFRINQSNLPRVVSSSNLDLLGGTGAFFVESFDDTTPLFFRSIPAVALYIEYSTDDLPTTCWFQTKMSGREILKSFPDYKGKMKPALLQKPDEIYAILYGQIRKEKDKYHIYCVMEDDPLIPLFEKDSDYQQILIYRDKVRPGEMDGRGVALDMLPTIIDLNKMVMYSRQSLAFKAFPPMFYEGDAYFNPLAIRQWAGAFIERRPQGRNPLEALEMPESQDTLKSIIALQEDIKRGFQVDPLGEITGSVKSATEVSIRENRAQRTSVTDTSRLINELPKQVFEVSAKILAKRRLLTKDRRIGSIKTDKLTFNFQSPLNDLQKQDDLNHFITYMQTSQQFFGEQATVLRTNMAEALEFVQNNLNLPARLFKEKRQFTQAIGQLMQAAQQATQLPSSSTSASQVSLPEQSQVLV